MALNVTFASIRAAIRAQLDAEGKTAVRRHSEDAVDDAAARGVAALYRAFRKAGGGDRFLTSVSVPLISGTATYTLQADLASVVLVELTSNGSKVYLPSYEHPDHAALTSPSILSSGIPAAYNVYGNVIEVAPAPSGGTQSLTVWYVPNVVQPNGSPTQTVDTVARFDDYAILYGVSWLARKDRAWDLQSSCTAGMQQVYADIEYFMRHRDDNSPPAIRDVYTAASRRIPGSRLR